MALALTMSRVRALALWRSLVRALSMSTVAGDVEGAG